MTLYEERVHLESTGQRIFKLFLGIFGAGVLAYLFWSFYLKDAGAGWHWLHVIMLAGFLFQGFLFGQMLCQGMAPQMELRVGEGRLSLRRGLARREMALHDIVEAKALPEREFRRTYRAYGFPFTWDQSFVSMRRGAENVKVVLTGGKSSYFASARAEQLAALLSTEAERARHSGVLGSVS